MSNEYGYNDKELWEDGDVNWLDYGFRNYDPQLGRFLQIDPLSDDYEDLSPYLYAYNDPIANVDIDGLFYLSAVANAVGQAVSAFTLPGVTVASSTKKAALKIAHKASTTARIWGALKAVGGALEVGSGAILSASGVGSPLGIALILHGADVASSGIMQTIRGEETRSFTEQGISKGLQMGGVSQAKADNIAGWADMGLSLAGGNLANAYKVSSRLVSVSPKLKIIKGAKADVIAFRSFTKSNFRTNLGRLTGNIPSNSQAHHVFPQAQRFSNFFRSRVGNIHNPKFGSWWETASHGKNARQYNEKWTQWIRNNQNASPDDVLKFGRDIMGEYGLPVNF